MFSRSTNPFQSPRNPSEVLLDACVRGDKAEVILQLNAGAEVNATDFSYQTPLMKACYRGNEAIVGLLCQLGADFNKINIYGYTPLWSACKGGRTAIVELLLAKGVEVNAKHHWGWWGRTPLKAACKGGHEAIAELLLKAGANVNEKDRFGTTPLMKACKKGHEAIAGLLIEYKANVNATSPDTTPLISACLRGHEGIAKRLIKAGADVNLKSTGHYFSAPLIDACCRGHEGIVRRLLKKDAKVNVRDHHGATPLTWACQKVDGAIAKRLLKAGADVNAADKRGETSLIKACKSGREAIVKLLLDAGADVNIVDRDGETALQKTKSLAIKQLIIAKMIEDASQSQGLEFPGNDLKEFAKLAATLVTPEQLEDITRSNEISEEIFKDLTARLLQNTESPAIKQLIIAKMIEDVCDLKFPGNNFKEFAKLAATLVTPEQLEYITHSNEIPEEIFEDLTAQAQKICDKKFYIIPNPEGEEECTGAVALYPIGDNNAKFWNQYIGVGQYFTYVKEALGFDVLDPDFQQTLSLLGDLPKKMRGQGEFKTCPTELMYEIMKFGFGSLYNESNPEVFDVLMAFFKVAKDREINLDNPFATSNFFLKGYVGVTIEEIPVEEEVAVAGESSEQAEN